MGSNQKRLQYLFKQFCNDAASQDEIRELWKLIAIPANDEVLKRDLLQLWDTVSTGEQPEKKDWDNTLLRIHQKAAAWENTPAPVSARRYMLRIAAAAGVLLVIGISIFFFYKTITKEKESIATTQPPTLKKDMPPASNGAVLTLSSGKQIVLDSATNGVLAIQGDTKIINKNGQIAYSGKGAVPNEILYNTMTTARGRQYQLTLADGSKVWLNAGSSIKYPTSFTENNRKVTLTGEAYFEVAKDASRPFLVTANGMEIKVLGTHFNINAYDDENAATTTLLEGRVKVTKNNVSTLLVPGQQTRVSAKGDIDVIKNADVDAAMAWRNGYFSFNNTDIKTVMRQLSRWYDIDVNYQGNILSTQSFWGDLQRAAPLSNILKVLEKSGVRFSVEGKTITVFNK